MAKVLTHMCMSLDGFVAQPDDNPGEWCGRSLRAPGPVEDAAVEKELDSPTVWPPSSRGWG
jgi:hypothetical protein